MEIFTGYSFSTPDMYAECTLGGSIDNADFVELIVRSDGTSQNLYILVLTNSGGAQTVYKTVSGVTTSIGTTPSMTFALGDVIRFSVIGSLLIVYQNGSFVYGFLDSSISAGINVGLQMRANSSLANATITRFSGGTPAGNATGAWAKTGVSVVPTANDVTATTFKGVCNFSVIYDDTPQLISPNPDGKVFKMWFLGGAASGNNEIFYAESNTGLGRSWTRRSSSVLTAFGLPRVYKAGSGSYVLYGNNGVAAPWTQIDRYTSSDGITWTLAQSSVLSVGGGGAWDSNQCSYLTYMDTIGGVWYGIYAGSNGTVDGGGLVTSNDGGITLSKYGSNPLWQDAGIPSPPIKVGSVYYSWINLRNQLNQPTRSYAGRRQTTDFKTWTNPVISMEEDDVFEGLNLTTGEMSGEYLVVGPGGNCFMWYNSSPNDATGSYGFLIQGANTPATAAQLIAGQEYFASQPQTGADAFPTSGDLNASWVTPTGLTKLTVVSAGIVEATATSPTRCIMANIGTAASAEQYSEITVGLLSGAGNNMFPMVRVQIGSEGGYAALVTAPNNSSVSAAIYKDVAGTYTQIGPSTTTKWQLNDTVRLAVSTVNGLPLLSFYQNGFLLLEVTDWSNAFTSGYPGIQIQATTLADAQISSWAGGNANVIPNYPSGSAQFIPPLAELHTTIPFPGPLLGKPDNEVIFNFPDDGLGSSGMIIGVSQFDPKVKAIPNDASGNVIAWKNPA
jgi:hypothetical protein